MPTAPDQVRSVQFGDETSGPVRRWKGQPVRRAAALHPGKHLGARDFYIYTYTQNICMVYILRLQCVCVYIYIYIYTYIHTLSYFKGEILW